MCRSACLGGHVVGQVATAIDGADGKSRGGLLCHIGSSGRLSCRIGVSRGMCRLIDIYIHRTLWRSGQVVTAEHLSVDGHVVGGLGCSADVDMHRAVHDGLGGHGLDVAIAVERGCTQTATVDVAVDGAVVEVDGRHVADAIVDGTQCRAAIDVTIDGGRGCSRSGIWVADIDGDVAASGRSLTEAAAEDTAGQRSGGGAEGAAVDIDFDVARHVAAGVAATIDAVQDAAAVDVHSRTAHAGLVATAIDAVADRTVGQRHFGSTGVGCEVTATEDVAQVLVARQGIVPVDFDFYLAADGAARVVATEDAVDMSALDG